MGSTMQSRQEMMNIIIRITQTYASEKKCTDGHMESWKKFVPTQSPPLDLGDYIQNRSVYFGANYKSNITNGKVNRRFARCAREAPIYFTVWSLGH